MRDKDQDIISWHCLEEQYGWNDNGLMNQERHVVNESKHGSIDAQNTKLSRLALQEVGSRSDA